MVLLILLFYINFQLILSENDIHYTDDNFHERVKEYDTTLVMFYAPWCGHCKTLKPEYDKAMNELSKSGISNGVMVKVDCTKTGEKICKELSIQGFPTVKLYKFGSYVEDYDGGRIAEDLVDYMKSKSSLRPMSLLENVEDLDNFLVKHNDSGYVIGFFEKDSLLEPIFNAISKYLWNKINFGHVTSKEAFDKYNIDNEGILFFRPRRFRNKFEDDQLIYNGKPDINELKDFIIRNNHGLVGHRVLFNTDEFKPPFIINYFNLDYKENAQFTKYWRNRILAVAKNFTNKLTFAMSSIIDFKNELKEYGLKDLSTTKPIVVGRDKTNLKYIMQDEFSIINLEAFASKLINGDLTPYFKSQPVRARKDGEMITHAVGTNFEELIEKSTRTNDVLVILYGSSCSRTIINFHKLGDKLEGENVEIIAIDYEENDVPSKVFKVLKCPTIYWVSKDNKENPVLYEGEPGVKNLLRFIGEHVDVELTKYDRDGNPREKEEL